MKRPQNFERIDRVDFDIIGHSFHTDLDQLQNKKESSWVWVFGNGNQLGDYAILFELKWEHDCYSMKRCVLGEGTTGDYIFQDNLLRTDMVKTKDEFVRHIASVIKLGMESGWFGSISTNNPITHKVVSTDASKTYEVVDLNDGTGVWTCTCPAFQYSKEAIPTCKHIKYIKN